MDLDVEQHAEIFNLEIISFEVVHLVKIQRGMKHLILPEGKVDECIK